MHMQRDEFTADDHMYKQSVAKSCNKMEQEKNGMKVLRTISVLTLAIFFSSQHFDHAHALPTEIARNGYAYTIVYNGKVISVDDAGYNNNPGHIYQAMAIKKDRIMALGTSEQIRAMADAHT